MLHPLLGAGAPCAARTRAVARPNPALVLGDDPRHLPDDRPRRVGGDHRAPEHRTQPGLLARRPVVGAERVRADLRRPAAARCARWGTSSAAAGRSSPASRCSRSPRCSAASRSRRAWLLGARAVQGIGAAIAAPATLALLTTSFRRGARAHPRPGRLQRRRRRRRRVGLVLGGMLTELGLVALGPVDQRAGRPRCSWGSRRVCCRRPSAARAASTSRAPLASTRRHDRARLRLRPRRARRAGATR